MPTIQSVLTELEKKGNPARVKAFANHGAPAEHLYGVSAGDMKVIARKLKGMQELAYELYDTGNCDAMFLAGLVADGSKMTKKLLDQWAKRASWLMLSETTVPRVASESPHAHGLALKWIESKQESVASCGWCTYSGYVTITPDEQLDLTEIKSLLMRIENEIDQAPNRVRYTMNGFVIAVGSFVQPLLSTATSTAKKLGKVDVELGGSACKVPIAAEAIEKVVKSNRVGKKRKSIKC